jgi:hypothetical protein
MRAAVNRRLIAELYQKSGVTLTSLATKRSVSTKSLTTNAIHFDLLKNQVKSNQGAKVQLSHFHLQTGK